MVHHPTRGLVNRGLVLAAIACCLLLQLHLVFVQPVNWDEFRFLGDVHAYSRGELSTPLLTFQVHLFGWLIGLGNEIDQVHAARVVMLALEGGTLLLIAAVARRFFQRDAAAFAALAYVSFSFVLQHGASFRFDPIVTFLTMLAAWLLLRESLRWAAVLGAGVSLAVAAIVTIKVALALPLFVAIALYRLATSDDRRDAFVKLAAAAGSALLSLALLYAWHVSTLARTPSGAAAAGLSSSYAKALRDIPFFPRLGYFLRAFEENPLHWLLLLLGISAVIGSLRTNRARSLLLLSFLLPLLSILFYRNAFTYYYAFVMAPAAVLFAAAAARDELKPLVGLGAVLLAGGAVYHHQRALSPDAADQRRTVEAVHAMFPRPVAYIDRCSIIASFPQAGLFMSTWWFENYIAARRPVMRDLLISKHPVFVVVDSPLLSDALEGDSRSAAGAGLMPADRETLRSNYVHQWGPIWIAGKQLALARAEQQAEFLIPGGYVLEAAAPILFDAHAIVPGEIVQISAGEHMTAAQSGVQRITFRWAAARPVREKDAPRELGFGRF